jgi:hypothetical protein
MLRLPVIGTRSYYSAGEFDTIPEDLYRLGSVVLIVYTLESCLLSLVQISRSIIVLVAQHESGGSGNLRSMPSNFFLHRTNYLPAAGFASSDPDPDTDP